MRTSGGSSSPVLWIISRFQQTAEPNMSIGHDEGHVVDGLLRHHRSGYLRWMEIRIEEAAEWVAAQNQVTSFNDKLRCANAQERSPALGISKVTVPVHEGGRLFYQKKADFSAGRRSTSEEPSRPSR